MHTHMQWHTQQSPHIRTSNAYKDTCTPIAYHTPRDTVVARHARLVTSHQEQTVLNFPFRLLNVQTDTNKVEPLSSKVEPLSVKGIL